MNLRPSGYEPDELPGCSTPRWRSAESQMACRTPKGRLFERGSFEPKKNGGRNLSSVLCSLSSDLRRPGGDLLSRVLRQSTIGAEAFDGRVRDGIGSYRLAEGHQAGEDQRTEGGEQRTAGEELPPRSAFAARRFKVEAKLVSVVGATGQFERDSASVLRPPSSVF